MSVRMAEQRSSDTADEEDNVEPDQAQGSSQAVQCCDNISTRKKRIQCSSCRGLYHRACVNITGDQARQIPRYECGPCRGVSAPNRVTANAEIQTPFDFDLLRHLRDCKANLSIISNIPRGARAAAANALSDLINNVVESKTPLSWAKLLCFAYHGLQKPKKEKATANGPSLVSKIKSQITIFVSSAFPPEEFPF